MTEADWLDCASDFFAPETELAAYPDRKLHLLTAAFLRRVWDLLPCDHTRFAVEATEQFADGRITADELAWVRSQATLETAHGLWLGERSWRDYSLIEGCHDADDEEYAWQVASQGGVLDGVRRGLDEPDVIAASAAGYALELVIPAGTRNPNDTAALWEWQSLYAVVREVLGEPGTPDRLDPEWLTQTVRLLARGIYHDRAFDRLPILADALQDAGCTDEAVLDHCRRPGGHVRGCWLIDLILGQP